MLEHEFDAELPEHVLAYPAADGSVWAVSGTGVIRRLDAAGRPAGEPIRGPERVVGFTPGADGSARWGGWGWSSSGGRWGRTS